jgi:hypothetical protein
MATTITSDNVAEQLLAEVQQRIEATEPGEWGDALDLAEGERFLGRYLGEEVSPETNRPVFLLLAPEPGVSDLGQSTIPVFIRERAMLRSEFDRVRPNRGDYIAIERGADKEGKENAYHNYGVAASPCPEPLPSMATAAAAGAVDDGVPFEPTV